MEIPEGNNSLIKQYLINLTEKFDFAKRIDLIKLSEVVNFSSQN